VLSNETHRFLVLEQLWEAKVDAQALILDPVGRTR
jgi:mannose-1-phosphate guanylyltransferase